MADPSTKSEQVENFLSGVLGHDRRESISSNTCVPPPVGCGGQATEFLTKLAVKEYTITGLCQTCQDSIFTETES